MNAALRARAIKEFRETYSSFLVKAHQLHTLLEIEAGEAPSDEDPMSALIVQHVCRDFVVPVAQVMGTPRFERILVPRHFAMTLSRDITGRAFEDIGRYFRKDHGTVMNACENVRARLIQSPSMAHRYARLKGEIIASLAALKKTA